MRVESRYRLVYKPLVFLACSAPFVLLVAGAFEVLGRDLGPDPVEYILHSTGKTALNLLLITLLVTPARQLGGWPPLVRLRRMLGVFSFFYAALHVLTYAVLDLGLDFATLGEDIVKRPYITVGFTALVILLALAATSTNGMMRRLGRRWQKLHRLVYVAAILGVWHFWWQVKADIREPLLYAAMLAVLLGYRVVRSRTARELARRFTEARTSAPPSESP